MINDGLVCNLNVDEEPALCLVCVVPGCLPVSLIHQIQGGLEELLQRLLLRLRHRQSLLQPVLHVPSLSLEISEAVKHTADPPLLQRLVDSVVHHVTLEAGPHHHLSSNIYQRRPATYLLTSPPLVSEVWELSLPPRQGPRLLPLDQTLRLTQRPRLPCPPCAC